MTFVSDATLAVLELSFLKGVGHKTLLGLFGAEPEQLKDEARWGDLAPPVRRALEIPGERDRVGVEVKKQLKALVTDGAHLVSPFDSEYPELLRRTPDMPALLFVKGNLSRDFQGSASVIGTREPTRSGVRAAKQITGQFVDRGYSIVSGLAKGIDKVAHETALERDGHTVAVLAHGLDHLYPAAHRPLAEAILAQGGALVTEYPYGTKPFGPQFVQRDRIQAGLSQGLVLVQTGMKGGSLHASRAILHYGRPLIVPLPIREDVEAQAPNVQGVQFLVSASDKARAEFLKTSPEAVREGLFVLRSREDYPALFAKLKGSGNAKLVGDQATTQTGLFEL